jgi:manganese transport protein
MASDSDGDTVQDMLDKEVIESSDEKAIQDPPESLWGIFKFLGPSFAIVAITVGAGELIATTAVGAEIGIVVLWFLLLSLIVKIGIQYQYARHGLITGKSAHEIFDEVPGKVFGHSWAWWWMVFFWVVVNNLLFMGIFFGAGTMLHYITGQTLPLNISLLIVLVITIYPALRGYDFVEKLSVVVVGSLTVLTVVAAIISFWSPYGLSVDDLVYGLSFNLPSGDIAVLLSAIGITGIAADGLVGYLMYAQETGYGVRAGPRDVDGWRKRMAGWLNVMKVDVLMSLLLVVVLTVAFFIIGASVVAGLGNYPAGPQLAVFLAEAYQKLIGPIGYWGLLIGGFFALYSTAFSETQLVATAWPDWVEDTEWGDDIDSEKVATFAAVAMPIVWYVGGSISGLITPLIVLGGALYSVTYIPEIAATAWTLRQEQNVPAMLQMGHMAKTVILISLIGSAFLVISAILFTFGMIG